MTLDSSHVGPCTAPGTDHKGSYKHTKEFQFYLSGNREPEKTEKDEHSD